MSLKDRLSFFFGRKISYLEKDWGMYNGYIGKVSDGIVKDDTKLREKLIELNLNPEYFFTGNGSPEKKNSLPISEDNENTVPFYDLDVMAHISECLDIGDMSPSDWLKIPGFSDCIACFPVYGASMEPRIYSGDIIAVSPAVTSIDKILWGEIYLVITDLWRVVKTVHPGNNDTCIILRSINPDYAGDTPVKATELRALYQVRGVVSRLGI